jgi:hypothetical protein
MTKKPDHIYTLDDKNVKHKFEKARVWWYCHCGCGQRLHNRQVANLMVYGEIHT